MFWFIYGRQAGLKMIYADNHLYVNFFIAARQYPMKTYNDLKLSVQNHYLSAPLRHINVTLYVLLHVYNFQFVFEF